MKIINADIKAKAMLSGVRLYEVAQRCQMSESAFNRRMCKELTPADRERFLRAIEKIAKEKMREYYLGITVAIRIF